MVKKRILFTGVSGLLGGNAAFEWVDQFQFIGVFNQHEISHFPKLFPQSIFLKGNLADRPFVEKMIVECKPDVIVHAAALTNIDECERNREWADAVNVSATDHLTRAAQAVHAKLVYISTDAFFDGKPGQRFSEEAQPDPKNHYALTKFQSEQIVLSASRENLVVRTNIYGWNVQDKLSFGEWIVQKAIRGETIPLFQDVWYSPILVQDLLRVLAQMIEKNSVGIFNVGADESLTKYDFGIKVLRRFGCNVRLAQASSVQDLPTYRSRNMSLNNAKARNAFPQCSFDVEKGIQYFYELYRSGYVSRLKGKEFQLN